MKNWLFALLLFCSLCAESKHSTTLILGYVEFPPFTFTNSSGKPDGFYIKKIEQVLDSKDFRHKAISLPTKRLIKYLEIGDVDIFVSINRRQELRDIALIGQQIVGTISLNIYSIGNKKLSRLGTLQNNPIIILRGYNYGGFIDYILDQKNRITPFVANTHESALNMLALKRANYLLAYQKPIDILLKKTPIEGINSVNLSQLPLYITVSKQTPQADELLNQLETAMLKMK